MLQLGLRACLADDMGLGNWKQDVLSKHCSSWNSILLRHSATLVLW
jgi:hypothetical protein